MYSPRKGVQSLSQDFGDYCVLVMLTESSGPRHRMMFVSAISQLVI